MSISHSESSNDIIDSNVSNALNASNEVSDDSTSDLESITKPKKITPQMRYYEKNQDKLRAYYRNKMREKNGHKPRENLTEDERLERTRRLKREYRERNKEAINAKRRKPKN